MPVSFKSSVSASLAKADLDREEARVTALLARLKAETAQARQQHEDLQVARRVWERIHQKCAEPDAPAISSPGPAILNSAPGPAPETEKAAADTITIKEAALKALKAVAPLGFKKGGIEHWLQQNIPNQTFNSSSLSVMLARLRDEDRAVRNQGNVWFFVPEKDRKAA